MLDCDCLDAFSTSSELVMVTYKVLLITSVMEATGINPLRYSGIAHSISQTEPVQAIDRLQHEKSHSRTILNIIISTYITNSDSNI